MNLEDRAYSLLDGIESKLTEEVYGYYCDKVEDCDGDSESLTAVIEELKGVCAKAHSTSKKLSMSDLEGSAGEDDLSLRFWGQRRWRRGREYNSRASEERGERYDYGKAPF